MAASIFSLRSCVAVAVMSGAQQSEIVRLGGAALGIRYDVIDLQQVFGAAAAPGGAVNVAATAPVALPDLAFYRRRDGAAGPADRLRCRSLARGGAAGFAHAAACRPRRRTFGAEVVSPAGVAAEVSGRSGFSGAASSSPGCPAAVAALASCFAAEAVPRAEAACVFAAEVRPGDPLQTFGGRPADPPFPRHGCARDLERRPVREEPPANRGSQVPLAAAATGRAAPRPRWTATH